MVQIDFILLKKSIFKEVWGIHQTKNKCQVFSFPSICSYHSKNSKQQTDQCGSLVTAQYFIRQRADSIPLGCEGRPDPKAWPWPFFASLFILLSPLPGAWLVLSYGMYPHRSGRGHIFPTRGSHSGPQIFFFGLFFAGFLTAILQSSFSYSDYPTEIKYIFKNYRSSKKKKRKNNSVQLGQLS